MRMRYLLTSTCLAAGLLMLPVGATFAAKNSAVSAAVATAPAVAAAPVVEPGALDALNKMSSYLRTLPSFEVHIATVREEVDDHDQKLQFLGTTTYKAKKPDGLVVDIAEDRRTRHFVYDGKTATMLAPKMGVYTTIAAPPNIKQLLDLLEDKYAIEFPLEDLFLWGTEGDRRADIKRAYLVGFARIAGQDADQYAFREDGIDWQIWIAKGNTPLPLRVVITGTDDPRQPQTEASLTWNTAPTFTADIFAFKAPPGAKPITIVTKQR
jgi:hypothetical protein